MKCEECGKKVDINNGVCTNCGLVFEDHPIDYDITGYTNGDERKEPQRPLTVLSWDDPDIGIKTYHSNKTNNGDLKHAFRTEKNTQPNLLFGRGYLNAHNEIRRLCSILKLNKNIQNDAIWILRKLTKEGFIQGSYKKYATYAAIVMIAARVYNRFPLEFSRIANHSDENIKKIRNIYKDLKKELKITSNPFYLEEIVQYHCGRLGLSFKETKKCIEFAKKIKIDSGKDLYGYSAAVIRIKARIQRKMLSDILNVSEPTITARERELRRNGL